MRRKAGLLSPRSVALTRVCVIAIRIVTHVSTFSGYRALNCRKVNSLLSAYLDAELTGAEMLAIRDHLSWCGACREEYEGLNETKRLVASLAFRAPRADLEELLMRDAARAAAHGYGLSGAASRLREWLQGGTANQPSAASTTRPLYLRPRPMVATVLLSVAGIWVASASVDSGDSGGPASWQDTAGLYPAQISTVTIISSPSVPIQAADGTWVAVSQPQAVYATTIPQGAPGFTTVAAATETTPTAVSLAPMVVAVAPPPPVVAPAAALAPISLSSMIPGGDAASAFVSAARRRLSATAFR